MTNKKRNNNFLIQGTILASAGILVRIIGLIYRVPLNRILGDEGAGYYSVAYDVYSILLLLSSMSLPIAVSKLVSAKIAKGELKNAYKVFKGALIFGAITGCIAGAFAWFGADFFATLMKYPSAANALRVLAPTLVIMGIVGVLRGFYQGLGDMVPTAVSQIFEQIVNAIVSIAAASVLFTYGKSLYALSDSESTTNACLWGATGGTLGTLSGAATALIFILIIFFVRKKDLKSKLASDTTVQTDSNKTITKMLFITIAPVLISTTIYQISNLIDSAIFGNVMSLSGIAEKTYSAFWGVYSSKYRVLTTVPIAIASALSSSIVPTISMSHARNDIIDVKRKIGLVIRFAMIIAIPCGIGLSVLGGPIVIMLFGNTAYDSLASNMMILSIFTVTTFSLSTITNAVLQGIGKLQIPMKNSSISLVIHLILLPLALMLTNIGIYGVAIFDAFFALIVCILNARSIKKYIGYNQEIKRTFIYPALAGIGMGIIVLAIYNLLIRIIPVYTNTIATILSILVGAFVYLILLLLLKAITVEELSTIPKGRLIIKLAQKLHLI
ncbi:MAG: oligosaccharide flippase family protein [Eubacterium sp.]